MGLPPSIQQIIGQRFNKLVPQHAWPVRLPSGKLTYKAMCKCDCGGFTNVFVNSLTQHRTGSCGCDKSRYEKLAGANNYNFKGHGEIRSALWEHSRSGAERRGIPFEITIEYGWQQFLAQGRRCAISGIPIQFGPIGLVKGSRNRHARTTASLDRVDNDKGYVEGNVQWVHKVVNLMRNKLSVEEFLVWCRRIAQFHDSTYGSCSA